MKPVTSAWGRRRSPPHGQLAHRRVHLNRERRCGCGARGSVNHLEGSGEGSDGRRAVQDGCVAGYPVVSRGHVCVVVSAEAGLDVGELVRRRLVLQVFMDVRAVLAFGGVHRATVCRWSPSARGRGGEPAVRRPSARASPSGETLAIPPSFGSGASSFADALSCPASFWSDVDSSSSPRNWRRSSRSDATSAAAAA